MKKSLTIAIAGGTGSGKSTVARIIKERFGDEVTLMRCDDYYKAQHEITYEERCKVNYDHPNAFDVDLMIGQIKKLQSGQEIDCPVYDFTIHDRSDKITHLLPTRVLVVDGILALALPELREICDIKIFVDTDADVRILRRIRRDVHERGRSLDSVIGQYLKTVKPMHDAYVEPSKRYADLIIPEGGKNTVATDLLCALIKDRLKETT